MRILQCVLAGLECRTVDWLREGRRPEAVAVFCHGFGAPAENLVPLAAELVTLRPGLADRVQFVFPAGPLRLDDQGLPGGRAWWHIDVNRLVAAVERGEVRLLRHECPQGMVESREKLAALVAELCSTTGLPASKLVLGGFSQGAMLATDLALRMDEAPGGLCVLSGTLTCEDDWRELAAKRGRLPIVQSHGYDDPILPFKAAEWLRDLLIESGMEVDFVAFPGMHSIPPAALVRTAALAARVAGGGGA